VEVVAEEVAVLEPGMVTGMVTVTVVEMGLPLAIAMAGRAPRSATAVGQRSLHPAVSIAPIRQRDGSPLRRRDGRTRPVE
jgi:hypothetical protein